MVIRAGMISSLAATLLAPSVVGLAHSAKPSDDDTREKTYFEDIVLSVPSAAMFCDYSLIAPDGSTLECVNEEDFVENEDIGDLPTETVDEIVSPETWSETSPRRRVVAVPIPIRRDYAITLKGRTECESLEVDDLARTIVCTLKPTDRQSDRN